MFGIVVAGLLLDREKEKDAKGMSRESVRESGSNLKLIFCLLGGGAGVIKNVERMKSDCYNCFEIIKSSIKPSFSTN